jgi:hypothetical protein
LPYYAVNLCRSRAQDALHRLMTQAFARCAMAESAPARHIRLPLRILGGFASKGPRAAEKAGMPLMECVIGGVDHGNPDGKFIREPRLWTALLCFLFRPTKETRAVLRTRSYRRGSASVSAFLDSFGELADQIASVRSVRNAPRTDDTHEPVR